MHHDRDCFKCAGHLLRNAVLNTEKSDVWQLYPSYYTEREGGEILPVLSKVLPLGRKTFIEKFNPHSIFWGEWDTGEVVGTVNLDMCARWDAINGWTHRPKIVRY